jgi:hypothetical protein
VTEPPWLWERAKDYLTKDEFEALKGSFSFDAESRRLIANGLGYLGIGKVRAYPTDISADDRDSNHGAYHFRAPAAYLECTALQTY